MSGKTNKERLADIEKKLSKVIQNQEKLKKLQQQALSGQEKLDDYASDEIKEEKELEKLEQKELSELDTIINLEKEIKKSTGHSILRKITYRDFVKGGLGAFVGVVGHFAFVKGTHLAHDVSFLQATILLVVAFIIGLLFLYYSGFRKVKKIKFLSFIPMRAIVVYLAAITVVVLVLLLFGFITPANSFGEVYKMVASISILAMLGAGTADLIGEN
mgnify:CR=1 FL=1